jgi:NodT family efflux transporter outer membrane factor (OMF) lipoprotein
MKHKTFPRAIAQAVTATALTACAVGPDFKQPDAPSTDRYTAQPLAAQTAAADIAGGGAQTFDNGKQLPAQWWTLFGSDKLNQLVQQALAGSPNLASAQAALRVARENYNASLSVIFPTFDGNASATRQKIDTASFGNPAGGVTIYNLYNASVNVSYGLDLFGGTRRGLEQIKAQLDFQGFQLEGTYQTLAANVVTGAVQEAQLRALVGGQKLIVEDLEHQLQISEKQLQLGAINRAALLSVQSALATEQARLPTLESQLSQVQNQLAVYLGKLPSERASTDFDLTELQLPQDLPISLPSDLVQQRADIRAAEAQLRKASAGIGIATANMLPKLSISASYGTEASSESDLFREGIWSIGANLVQPLFHAGELTSKRRAALAAYDQASADYKLTVLRAFQNVADVLRSLDADAQILKAQVNAANAAEGSLHLTERQYALGSASYLDLLAAQKQFTQARTGFVQAAAGRLQDTAALFLALGGGWWNRGEPATDSVRP